MTALNDQLIEVMRRNDLPEFVRRLREVVEDESRRRERFREDLNLKFQRAEFINGEVIVPSPMKFRHRMTIDRLGDLAKAYLSKNPIGLLRTDGLLIETTRNDYEPDVYFWPKQISDAFTPEQEVFPPPAFIAEVLSPSTQRRDRGVKFEDYAAHGVREYWIVDPEHEMIEQYVLAEAGQYELREKVAAASGAILRSEVIEGLALPVKAVFDDEANRAALERERRGE